MLLLEKAHLGEVGVTVRPKVLKEMGRRKNIFVLERVSVGAALRGRTACAT